MGKSKKSIDDRYLGRAVSFKATVGAKLETLTGRISRIVKTRPLTFEVRCAYGDAFLNEEIRSSRATFEPGQPQLKKYIIDCDDLPGIVPTNLSKYAELVDTDPGISF